MRKGKNITMLIGLACVFVVLLWQIIKAVFHCFSVLDANAYKHLMVGEIFPVVITILSLIVPVMLLVRNVKNKTGKALPIISIIVTVLAFLWVLVGSLPPAIPQYLIISKLGLIDTYVTAILLFLGSGGLFSLVGYTLLIIGSFLSLPGKQKNG